jgi:hypothetical protein
MVSLVLSLVLMAVCVLFLLFQGFQHRQGTLSLQLLEAPSFLAESAIGALSVGLQFRKRICPCCAPQIVIVLPQLRSFPISAISQQISQRTAPLAPSWSSRAPQARIAQCRTKRWPATCPTIAGRARRCSRCAQVAITAPILLQRLYALKGTSCFVFDCLFSGISVAKAPSHQRRVQSFHFALPAPSRTTRHSPAPSHSWLCS